MLVGKSSSTTGLAPEEIRRLPARLHMDFHVDGFIAQSITVLMRLTNNLHSVTIHSET